MSLRCDAIRNLYQQATLCAPVLVVSPGKILDTYEDFRRGTPIDQDDISFFLVNDYGRTIDVGIWFLIVSPQNHTC